MAAIFRALAKATIFAVWFRLWLVLAAENPGELAMPFLAIPSCVLFALVFALAGALLTIDAWRWLLRAARTLAP